MKTTNKAIAQLLINAGIEKAIYSNARKQLPENAGFRLQTFKNEYHNILSIYAAPTTWNEDEQVAMVTKMAKALSNAGLEFQVHATNITIAR
jgi:glutamine synthetase adenylyltransferase